MSTRSVVVAVLMVLVLGAGAGFLVWWLRAPASSGEQSGTVPNAELTGKEQEIQDLVDLEVPEGTSTVPENVAKPGYVVPTVPGAETDLRNFGLVIANGSFSLDTIIVREGDTVHLNILSEEKAYDFVQPEYGLQFNVEKGVNRVLEFSAVTPGIFQLYCESCGGPKWGPVANIKVVPK